jgi:hypothetical protein
MYDDDERGGVLVMEIDPATGGMERVEPPTYIVNPERRNLADLINRHGKIEWPAARDPANPDAPRRMTPANGQFMYVVDVNGNVFLGSRAGQRMPHPTLVGGPNPQVLAAGIMEIRGGKLFRFDNDSGHFKPGAVAVDAATRAIDNILPPPPPEVRHKNYQGGVAITPPPA